jgi:hypothetical protein
MSQRFGLFGHSSGGQFAHRMITLGFRDGVGAAATANAGTYTMPDPGVTFPYGLGDVEIDDNELCALLAFKLTVFAGTADIDTTSEHFPREAQAMRQGPTRYARAHAYNGHGSGRRSTAGRPLQLDHDRCSRDRA